MSESLTIMAEEEKKDGNPEPHDPPNPTKKRGRPRKQAVDAPPASADKGGKDVRPPSDGAAPQSDPPSPPPPPVAKDDERPPPPRTTRTVKRSRPSTPRSERSSEPNYGLVILGGLIGLGLIYLLKTRDSAPTNAPPPAQSGSVMSDIERAWKDLEGEVVNVTDKLTMLLGKR